MEEEARIRSGNLTKCHKGVSKLYNRKHSQFVVLTHVELRWSNDEASDNAGCSRGSCHLLNVAGVRMSESHPDRFHLALEADVRNRVWRAHSPEDAQEWVAAIKAAIAAVRKRASEEGAEDDKAVDCLEKVHADGVTETVTRAATALWGEPIPVGTVRRGEHLLVRLRDGGACTITREHLERSTARVPVSYPAPRTPTAVQVTSAYTTRAEYRPAPAPTPSTTHTPAPALAAGGATAAQVAAAARFVTFASQAAGLAATAVVLGAVLASEPAWLPRALCSATAPPPLIGPLEEDWAAPPLPPRLSEAASAALAFAALAACAAVAALHMCASALDGPAAVMAARAVPLLHGPLPASMLKSGGLTLGGGNGSATRRPSHIPVDMSEWVLTLQRAEEADAAAAEVTASAPLVSPTGSITSLATYDLSASTNGNSAMGLSPGTSPGSAGGGGGRRASMKAAAAAVNAAAAAIADEDVPVRYVRGCKGDMVEAKRRYAATLAWRKEEGIDGLLREPQPNFALIKQHYPHFYCGRGRSGNLVYYERIGGVNMKAMAAGGVDLDAMLRYYVFQTEFLWKVLDTREDDGRLITVFDVNGVGFRDAFGEAMGFVKAASGTAGQHYPERCQMIIIANVPSWFNTLWKAIKAFIDPATLDKIKILKGSAIFDELSQHVDPSVIPTEYGGTCSWPGDFGDEGPGSARWNSPEEVQLREYVEALNAGKLPPVTPPPAKSAGTITDTAGGTEPQSPATATPAGATLPHNTVDAAAAAAAAARRATHHGGAHSADQVPTGSVHAMRRRASALQALQEDDSPLPQQQASRRPASAVKPAPSVRS